MQLTEVKDEDVKRGFELYSLLVFCPGEAAKLYKFLANLINGEKGATILRSTINTLVANQLTEEKSKHGLISFYHELDHLFNLQFGKILFAMMSSYDQLETIFRLDAHSHSKLQGQKRKPGSQGLDQSIG